MFEIRESELFTHSSDPIWEHAVGVPTSALQYLVHFYSGYYHDLAQPASRLQVPSAEVILVLGFGDELEIRQIGSSSESGMYQSFVVGLEAQPLLSEHDGERYCIAIPLPPWAAYRLFQGAITEFAKEVVALEDIWDDADRLTEQLSERPSWTQRFACVERILKEKFSTSQRRVRPEIRWAGNQLEAHGGCILIRQLAQTIGWSDRYFAKQFRAQIGMTPKAAARQIRFTQAQRLLNASEKQTLSEIALACGYSDQSHFTREFHSFSGCSPNAFQKAKTVATDLPDLPGEPDVPEEIIGNC